MNILEKILAQKKLEIAALDAQALRHAAEQSPTPRDFLTTIQRRRFGTHPSLIAELKRASPSKGILAPRLDLFQVADISTQNGASAISVLTDEKFFMGSLQTLRELRARNLTPDTSHVIPLLRKDFIIHETQLYEARANGADAILLIAAALTDDALLADLHACPLGLGLTALVEALLSSLNGGRGVALDKITITNSAGDASEVDLSSLSATASIGDVMAKINAGRGAGRVKTIRWLLSTDPI